MIYYTNFYIPQLKTSFLIAKNKDGVCSVVLNNNEKNFVDSLKEYFDDNIEKNKNKLKKEVEQILEYFSGKRKTFSVRIFIKGSKFQTSVWQEILKLKFGETKSYSDIAGNICNPNATRAVGNACGQNPIPIIIPCHRVIKKDNSLGGFSGPLTLKQKMLNLESKF